MVFSLRGNGSWVGGGEGKWKLGGGCFLGSLFPNPYSFLNRLCGLPLSHFLIWNACERSYELDYFKWFCGICLNGLDRVCTYWLESEYSSPIEDFDFYAFS